MKQNSNKAETTTTNQALFFNKKKVICTKGKKNGKKPVGKRTLKIHSFKKQTKILWFMLDAPWMIKKIYLRDARK